VLSAEEAATSESRHVLTRSLGPEMFVSADAVTLTVQANDIFVLSTDGVHDSIHEQMLADLVSQGKDVASLAQELVRRAVELDGGDNASAQVIRVRGVEPVGMYRGRPYRLPS
jgi:protein phosphatase